MNLTYEIFAIKDQASDSFGLPFFAPTSAHALRSFRNGINDTEEPSDISRNPQDFSLWQLGQYDSTTGHIVRNDDMPQQIALGRDLVQKRN